MNREDLVALRHRLIMGDPPYTARNVGPIEEMNRAEGVPGIDERRRSLNQFDVNAAGTLLAMEACLQLTEHLLERMRK